MATFLKTVIKLLLCFLGILVFAGLWVEYRIYQNTKDTFYARQGDWHIQHQSTMEVLFVGNSRTSWHIDMARMMAYFQKPMYCLTVEGRKMPFFWFKFKHYLKQNKAPKIIVLQCDLNGLPNNDITQNNFILKERYLAYLFGNRLGINAYFKQEKGYHAYESYIPLVRYIHFPNMFYRHFVKDTTSPYKAPNYYGSKVIGKNTSAKLRHHKPKIAFWPKAQAQSRLDLRYIDSFKAYCSAHHIKLLCVYPPQYWPSYLHEDPNELRLIDRYFLQHGMPFKSFNSFEYSSEGLFDSYMHLNQQGIQLYTQQLIQFMEQNGCKPLLH